MSQNPISNLVDSLDALSIAQNTIPIEFEKQPNGFVNQRNLQKGDDKIKTTPLQAVNQLQNVHDLTLLSAIEALLDLPISLKTTPRSPDESDVNIFKQELQVLRPSDYDDLIEERNIDGKCGYALCSASLSKIRRASTGRYRILTSAVGKGRIVEQRVLDRFCQEDCARRALYVRVQLSEEPGWMRSGLQEGDLGHTPIVLLDEKPVRSHEFEKSETMKQDEALVLDQLSKLGIDKVDVNITDNFKAA